jgi:hypothetical protein
MQYLTERYEDLTDVELNSLRELGERYCQPVRRTTAAAGVD